MDYEGPDMSSASVIKNIFIKRSKKVRAKFCPIIGIVFSLIIIDCAKQSYSNISESIPRVEGKSNLILKNMLSEENYKYFVADILGYRDQMLNLLKNVSHYANSIDDNPSSTTFGKPLLSYPSSRLPGSARVMEPMGPLFLAYTLNEPFNPYYHDSSLKQRLDAILNYWLSLQKSNGCLGLALVESSFSGAKLVDVYDYLKDDDTFSQKQKIDILKSL